MVSIFPFTVMRELLFQHHSHTLKFHHLFWNFSESFHRHSNNQTAADWVTRFSICASVSRCSTNFAATCHIFSLSVKIRWHKLLHIPTSSATSRTVRWRFWRNHSKHFLNRIVVHWRGRMSRFGVIFAGRSARFETPVPLVTLRLGQTILSISLLQHLKSSRKSFSQCETEFDANALLLKVLPFFNLQKFP